MSSGMFNAKRPKNRQSLTNNLETKILNYVREHTQPPLDSAGVPGIPQLYRLLQERDAQLRRMKKAQLESSIQRALNILQNEIVLDSDDESLDSDFEGLEDLNLVEVKDPNTLNRLITSQWTSNQSPLASGNQTPREDADGEPSPKVGGVENPVKRKQVKSRSQDQKRQKTSDWSPPTSVSLQDLGGIDDCLQEVLELIVMPLKHPEIYTHTGIQPPRGVLLYGPPGCGKTLLANALAGDLGLPFISLSAPTIVSGMSGESEKKVRDIFEEAKKNAPCLMFIDEIDAVTQKRETAQREMERRIVAQLLTCMDDLSLEKTDGKPVLIIGATNRPDSLDPALRRAGRFDREICMNVPNDVARESILQVLCKKLRLSGDFDYKKLAKETPGFVGADLQALTSAAGVIAFKRMINRLQQLVIAPTDPEEMEIDGAPRPPHEEPKPVSMLHAFIKEDKGPLTADQMEDLFLTQDDFLAAIPKIQPSAKREGFATVPDVTWEDVGALVELGEQLQLAIVRQIREPETYSQVGITAPSGILLWGPPGCGKTLLAKAVANESRANFISIKGPELLNKYVGESERAVRQVFQRARASAPCIIFFDELDALVPKRDNAMTEASSRVVNTLLTELDGLNDRRGVYVIAATNRPDMIDPAMIRPGRLDQQLFVGLPSANERFEILKTLSKKTPLDPDIDLHQIAQDNRARNFSGADLSALIRQAAILSIKKILLAPKAENETRPEKITVGMQHFEGAFGLVHPSVSDHDRQRYEHLRNVFMVSS